jgi:hypothetical protein
MVHGTTSNVWLHFVGFDSAPVTHEVSEDSRVITSTGANLDHELIRLRVGGCETTSMEAGLAIVDLSFCV